MARGCGRAGEHVERLLARSESRTAAVGAAEEDLAAEVVAAWVEVKAVLFVLDAGQRRSLARPALLQAPSGKDMRERCHVGLGVAAVDAERVQFHHLARVVLVNAFEFAAPGGAVG